jgi:hypothetical protein
MTPLKFAPITIFENIVFMKFGFHAQEHAHDIITRKKLEFQTSGLMFWGYNGTLCNPVKQVQPFVKSMNEQNSKVYLAMSYTRSKPANAGGIVASEYSIDNVIWSAIPDGIKVIGSKYAIVCSDLITTSEYINFCEYKIAIGHSEGTNANNYIRYQVDKGCMKKTNKNVIQAEMIKIELYAEIVYPYAVFLYPKP